MKKLFIVFFFQFLFFANAINPIFPTTAFIPDGEPHVFEYKGEKRVFIYGSRDERITGYCGFGHDVWSAPFNDLTKWTNHGEVFHVKQVQAIGYGIVDKQHFGAPDCVYNPITKKYYLYTFLGATYIMDGVQGPIPGSKNYIPGFENLGPKCVMAVSDSPAGPFLNPVICNWPAANNAGAFDPSAIVDQQTDGSVRVYVYWGMKKGDRWAEVDPTDMHTIINSETRKQDINAWYRTLNDDIERSGSSVFEASSIKKIAPGKYVFIYSSNEHKSSLTYCYSNSPKGPWKYGGIIINNAVNWKFGNDHGSIVKVGNSWYVVYHRHSTNSYSRQAMMEPIQVSIEGDKVIIPQVEMTSQGVEANGLAAFKRYNAGIACYRTNNAFVDGKQRNTDGLDPLVNITDNTIIGYKYLNFGEKSITEDDDISLKLNIRKLENTSIRVQVAIPNMSELIEIASFKLEDYMNSNDTLFHEITIPINKIAQNKKLSEIGGLKGKLGFYLTFNGTGTDLCHMKEFEFVKGNDSTPNPLNLINLSKNSTKAQVVALPSKAREGESVKLTIIAEKGYCIKSISIKDSKGKKVKIDKNCNAPYANLNYNFEMPAGAVTVETKHKRIK